MIKLINLLKEQGKINNTLLVNYLGQLMSKYKTADEFKKAEPKAFKKAKELGVLKSLFKDEFRRKTKWTPDALKQAAAPYKGRTEFYNNNPSAYLRALEAGIMDDLFPEKTLTGPFRKKRTIIKWTPDEIKQAAAPYKTRSEFKYKNNTAYYKALEAGMIDDLFPEKQPTGKKALTPDEIKQAAAPYKTRSEFALNKPTKYVAALRNNMLDDLFPEKLPAGRKSKPPLTPDEIKQAAAPYKGRGEFQIKNRNAYVAARKAGMLDDLFPEKLPAGRKSKPSPLSEDINRDPRYWINEFNLLGVVQQFSNQFQQRMGVPFYGKLNLIVFDRNDLKEVEDHVDKNRFLSGWVPKGKDEFWDEDFMITLENIYPESKLISELTPIKDKVFLMQIECSRNPQNGETVVSLPSYW